jgi:hypothetical protein
MSHAPIGPPRASFTGGSHDRVHDAGELPSLLADLHEFSGEVARWAAACVCKCVSCVHVVVPMEWNGVGGAGCGCERRLGGKVHAR